MRSFLFVPADGSKKLDKAMASGADAVIIDLEDSIAPEAKAAARKSAAAFLTAAAKSADRPHLLVRVNGIATGLIDEDLEAVRAATHGGHRGQDLVWDGRKVLAELMGRHGGIQIPAEMVHYGMTKAAQIARPTGVQKVPLMKRF